jgi:hypothetical protein
MKTNDKIDAFNGNLLNEITLDIVKGLHIKLLLSVGVIFKELPIMTVTIMFIQIPRTKIRPFKLAFNIESNKKNDITNNEINALINE